MFNRIFIIVCAGGLLSCTAFIKQKYGLQRPFRFDTKKDFLRVIEKENLFPSKNILYIDSSSVIDFFQDMVQKENISIYIGAYLNDTILIKRSDYLNENESCRGRIENEMLLNTYRKEYPDSLKIKTKKFSSYKLCRLSNNSAFVIDKDLGKLTFFLLYSYSSGTYYRPLYQKAFELQHNNPDNIDIYIISTDPIQWLK
ncbi:MAG: hypothetical protein FGM46_01170 [Ferruginibacter sp.]|nr:hypothetical protein [Ferruginibacter sp.]